MRHVCCTRARVVREEKRRELSSKFHPLQPFFIRFDSVAISAFCFLRSYRFAAKNESFQELFRAQFCACFSSRTREMMITFSSHELFGQGTTTADPLLVHFITLTPWAKKKKYSQLLLWTKNVQKRVSSCFSANLCAPSPSSK